MKRGERLSFHVIASDTFYGKRHEVTWCRLASSTASRIGVGGNFSILARANDGRGRKIGKIGSTVLFGRQKLLEF